MTRLFKNLFSLLLFISAIASAQVTNVTGTIVDGDNTTWFNAQVNVVFVPNPNYPNQNQYTIGGVPLTSPNCNLGVPCSAFLNQHVLTNASGAFSFAVIDSNQIAPSGSTWKFTIQSYTSAPASVFPNLAISGTSQDVSAFIHTNITSPRFPAVSGQYGGGFGYNTNEVSVIPIPGGSFFNVTTGGINVWTCTSAGCSWAFQSVGSFCSTVGCTFTGPLFARNINNICEASQEPGADFAAQMNACASESYMAGGGVITGYGYAATTQTASTVLTAGSNPAQPITFVMNPAATFVFNQNVGSTAPACIICLANGSSFQTFMAGISGNAFPRANLQLGPSAVTYDFIANKTQDSTQEGFVLNALFVQGNASATMAGSLIHDKNTFIGTRISNVATYHPYGTAFTLDNGSDQYFDNDNFADSASSGQYPGATVVMNCPNHVTFSGGAIQDNGIFNPLLVINSNSSGPGCGSIAQPVAVRFYGTDFELQAATVGSFTGHATNVDPIQVNDAGAGFYMDSPFFYGNYGAGQHHMIDFFMTGGGYQRGPIEIKNLSVLIPAWNVANSVIHNTEPNINGTLADIFASQDGAGTASVASYFWSGGLQALGNSTSYRDNEYIANIKTYRQGITTKPVSALPACPGAGSAGMYDSVSDSTTKIPGQTITGGGFNNVLSYCNGSNWIVAASASTNFTQAMTICASGCTQTATICTTSGIAWAGGACFVGSFSWPVPWPDTNYGVSCQSVGTLSGSGTPELVTVNEVTKSNTAIGISLASATTSAATVSEIDCVGVHN